MAKSKILLVEDEAVTALDLKSTLLDLGYEVVGHVVSGEEAVVAAGDLHPDLVLMDIRLDGPMSGIEAAAEIKQTHAIPLVYLTAHTDIETLNQAKITEPFGYLPKPWNTNTLATTIEMALYKAEAEAARQRAEDKVHEVLREQKIILDNIGVGVAFLKNRRITWANQAFARMFGYSLAEVKDHDTEIFYSERASYLDLGQKGYAALARGETYTCQLLMRKKDGTPLWCNLVGQAINAADLEQGAIWVLHDMTEQRRMEETLRRSEEKYRTVAEYTHDWEFWIGPDERIIYCSPSCETVTGHPAMAFENDPALLRRLIHPDDLQLYAQHRHGVKDQDLAEELEFRILRADGEIRWLSHVCRSVFDSQGKFAGNRGSNRDITERKALEAEVLKARNLESLGVLAGGIAHDFNNLFQGLLGNLSLAKMCTPESSEAFQFLKSAEQVYAAATKLTGQLVAFSSGGISLRTNIQPAALIQETASSSLKESGLEVEFEMADDLGIVNVDPSQLRQVIKHLLQNAWDAMPAGGRVQVRATNETLSQGAVKTTALAAGNYVKITIKDQGCGISKENLPRIFDPYFSTKQRGSQKGMGLGLPLCDTIIRKHGGALKVNSKLGKGTTFHLYLPAAVSAEGGKSKVTREEGGQGPRILIMDDEWGVVQVASKFLALSGFRVDSTPNGDTALAAFRAAREAGDPYAVVILDLAIPGGMGGQDTITALREIDPGVKAVVSSGYINDPAITDYAAHGFSGALVKPYGLREMKEILDQLL